MIYRLLTLLAIEIHGTEETPYKKCFGANLCFPKMLVALVNLKSVVNEYMSKTFHCLKVTIIFKDASASSVRAKSEEAPITEL